MSDFAESWGEKVTWRGDSVPNSWRERRKWVNWLGVREEKWPVKQILSLTLGGNGGNRGFGRELGRESGLERGFCP